MRFFSSPQDNFSIRDDRALSDNDQRQRLTVSGQLNVPRAIQLSAIYTYGSPFPFNVVTGGQTLQTTAARVAGIGRNTGIGFNLFVIGYTGESIDKGCRGDCDGGSRGSVQRAEPDRLSIPE